METVANEFAKSLLACGRALGKRSAVKRQDNVLHLLVHELGMRPKAGITGRM